VSSVEGVFNPHSDPLFARLPEYTKLEYIKVSTSCLISSCRILMLLSGNRLYTHENSGRSGYVDTTGRAHGPPLQDGENRVVLFCHGSHTDIYRT